MDTEDAVTAAKVGADGIYLFNFSHYATWGKVKSGPSAVRTNSGIHNKAAHTILTTRRGGQFLFTAAQVAAMFYLALTQSLSRTSDFAASRRAVELWARSLFRNDADKDVKVQAVNVAFSGSKFSGNFRLSLSGFFSSAMKNLPSGQRLWVHSIG